MKKKWSKCWKSSKQVRKQRKYVHNAPLHIVRKMFSVTLADDLRKKYGKRNMIIRKGDKVKILRGQFKKKTGKVEKVSLSRRYIFVEDANIIKKDGKKIAYPIHPSNLMIIELNLEDKKRKEAIERK